MPSSQCSNALPVLYGGSIHAFHLTGKFLFQRLEREEVVSKDDAVVEDVFFAGAVLSVVAFGEVFQENAGFEAGAGVFADPGEFKALEVA
ncbi:MAG: hypothetical protein LBT14_07315 [Treponema sp.]|jgi:hypothetical protein|nr:hypothetical protein [Treponema sp.]